jgi:hypothetical protein
VKFADADLIGIPVRNNVGDRGLKEGKIEVKPRKSPDAEMVALDGVQTRVRREINGKGPALSRPSEVRRVFGCAMVCRRLDDGRC